jgi:hypothetical protein
MVAQFLRYFFNSIIEICRFKNRPHMTFDDVRAQADQEFELARDPSVVLEYSTK